MSTKESIGQLLETLPEDRLRELLAFARFLASEGERQEWQRFGRAQLARAYGPAEPDYSEADLRGGSGQ